MGHSESASEFVCAFVYATSYCVVIFCSIDYIPCAENVFVILLYLASFHMPVWCRIVQTVANLCIRVWHTLQTCVREEFNQENMCVYRYIESKYKQHGMRVYMHVGLRTQHTAMPSYTMPVSYLY